MSLISPKLRSYFKKSILLGQHTCCQPYSWNKSQSRPEPCRSKLRFSIWCLNVVITLFYSLFVLTRCVQVNLDNSGKYGHVRKMYMKCIVIYYAFPALYQIVLVLQRSDLLLFFQQNVTLMDQLAVTVLRERNNSKKRNDPLAPKILDLFLDFIWYSYISFPFLIGFSAAVNPNSPEFISSVILPEKGLIRWIILIPCVLFQTCYIQTNVANSCLFTYFAFGFIFPCLVILKEIKYWVSAERISKERVKLVLYVYKQLEIMRKSFHFVLCTFFVPAIKAIIMSSAVYCCYGAVRMHGFIIIFLVVLGGLCFIMLVVLMLNFAKYDTASSEILFLMKSPKFYSCMNACQRKVHSSLTPLRIQMGSSYFVDTPCVITVLKIVLDSTINLLLTYR